MSCFSCSCFGTALLMTVEPFRCLMHENKVSSCYAATFELHFLWWPDNTEYAIKLRFCWYTLWSPSTQRSSGGQSCRGCIAKGRLKLGDFCFCCSLLSSVCERWNMMLILGRGFLSTINWLKHMIKKDIWYVMWISCLFGVDTADKTIPFHFLHIWRCGSGELLKPPDPSQEWTESGPYNLITDTAQQTPHKNTEYIYSSKTSMATLIFPL